MTVIVYRDGVMAADRMQSTGNVSEPVRTKIFIVTPKDHVRLVVGLCGTTKGTAEMLKHLEQHGTEGGHLDLTALGYQADHTYGYAVSAYGTVWQIYGDGSCLEPEPKIITWMERATSLRWVLVLLAPVLCRLYC